MWNEIAAWQEVLKERPDLSAKTIALYTQDARRFATWPNTYADDTRGKIVIYS